MGWSSASRIRGVKLVAPSFEAAAVAVGAARGLGATAAARGRTTLKVKVAPSPGVASAQRSPSMARARDREMARPRPVPPNRRVIEPSACSNRSNNRSRVASSKPMPLSCTAKVSRAPSSAASAPTLTRTDPSVVNFTALEIMFDRICRTRATSPA